VSFLEKRETPGFCRGPEGCGHDESAVDRIVTETLAGCAGVIVMRIGERPARRLREAGLRILTTYDYVTDAVRRFAE